MEPGICSVVLTYNQKDYLLECLQAITGQSLSVNTIFVIDNASEDGTWEALAAGGYLSSAQPPAVDQEFYQEHNYQGTQIRYVRLKANTGAAGGYAEGFRRAYNAGFEWIWVSDADGLADRECLKTLLSYGEHLDFLAPLLLNRQNPSELCFRLREDMSSMFTKVYTRVSELEPVRQRGTIPNTANPWSSSLIHRRYIDKVGFPKVEYFLAGEDYEYVLRGIKAGLRVATVVFAKCYHPRQDKKKSKFLMYLRHRNYLDLFLVHYGPLITFLHMLKTFAEKVKSGDWDGFTLALRAWRAAMRQDWTLYPDLRNG
jgi:rhamnopyranosyl-N-acetylglucosaminyl-diphospho-decaprenol beta-1,3/1,4-galactofuranosyltransferase